MAGPQTIPSLWRGDADQQTTDRQNGRLDALQLWGPGELPREPKLRDNAINLTAGQFPFFRQQRDNLTVQGIGAVVDGMETNLQSVWMGCRFSGPVRLDAQANCRFVGCRFDQVVTMVAGSRASFAGCHFVQNVQNAGVPANAGVFGCRREGAAHVNVTVIFEQ